jgi:hypothetical protein
MRSYAQGSTHTQTFESAFSLLKRKVYGAFHKVSIKHLGRYGDEFPFRVNRRERNCRCLIRRLKNPLRGEALPSAKLTASQVLETWNLCGLELLFSCEAQASP